MASLWEALQGFTPSQNSPLRKIGSLLDRPDNSVMDNYQPPQPRGLLDPEKDAIGPPSVLGGLLSLDPTDYIGPNTLK